MLIFNNVMLFQTLYDCAKKQYPFIEDVEIYIDYEFDKFGVKLLEGTKEDKGKFQITISPTNDERMMATYFVNGLTMLILKLKYGDISNNAHADKQEEVENNIMKEFETKDYNGEYVYK